MTFVKTKYLLPAFAALILAGFIQPLDAGLVSKNSAMISALALAVWFAPASPMVFVYLGAGLPPPSVTSLEPVFCGCGLWDWALFDLVVRGNFCPWIEVSVDAAWWWSDAGRCGEPALHDTEAAVGKSRKTGSCRSGTVESLGYLVFAVCPCCSISGQSSCCRCALLYRAAWTLAESGNALGSAWVFVLH